MHDWTDLAEQATVMSREQRWEEIPGLVHEEMLHTIATVGTYDEIGQKLVDKYGDVIDRIEFSVPVNNPDDASQLSSILRVIQGS